MSSRIRLTATGIVAAALAAALTACGGSTVEGQAPEVSSGTSDPIAASSTSRTTFAQERPEKPTSPVSPPPSPAPAPADQPAPRGQPPAPAPDGPAPEAEPPSPPASMPGTGDFPGVLQQMGVALPEGIDPVATGTETCARFDGGQQMIDVSGWLGEHTQLDPDGQGRFLGAAVGTYCPQNFPKLG